MSIIESNVNNSEYYSFFQLLSLGGLVYYIEHYSCYDKLLEIYHRRVVLDLDDDYIKIETPELEFLGINGYEVLLNMDDDKLSIFGIVLVSTKFVRHLVEFKKEDFNFLDKYLTSDYDFKVTNAVVNSFEDESSSIYYLLYKDLSYRGLDFKDKDVNILFVKDYYSSLYSIYDMSSGEEIELKRHMFNPYLFVYLFNDLNIRLNEEKLSVFIESHTDSEVLRTMFLIDLSSKLDIYIDLRKNNHYLRYSTPSLLFESIKNCIQSLGSDFYSNKITIKLIFNKSLNESDDFVKLSQSFFLNYFKDVLLYTD